MKTSIRFFNDQEVRAVWDEGKSKWWFSVLDVVGILNNQSDYAKNRNYWKYLKAKLKKDKNEVVSGATQLKFTAPDGKCVDWSKINKNDYLNAMIVSRSSPATIKSLLKNALTDKINDRDIFMKGIDYSYYYEQES